MKVYDSSVKSKKVGSKPNAHHTYHRCNRFLLFSCLW